MAMPHKISKEVLIKNINVSDDFKSKVNTFCTDLITLSRTGNISHLGINLLKNFEQNILTIAVSVFLSFAPQ